MVITSILNPSNRFFVSQYLPDFQYNDTCLSGLQDTLYSESGVIHFEVINIDNIAYLRLDATLLSTAYIENISNGDIFPFLNKRLESCIDDYSIYVLSQSTICECNPDTTLDIRDQVNIIDLCDEFACDCGGKFNYELCYISRIVAVG